jgi:hypothetical protein
MTTDIARVDDNANGLAPPAIGAMGSVTTDAMARLAEWVNAASQAHKLVAPLIDSAFVPVNFKPRVAPNASDDEKFHAREVAIANGTSAVLLGLNLGFDPLTALQQIILISNRPSMYAKAKVAILTSRGYDIWTKELTDEKAVICVVRPNTGGRIEEFSVTMEQAKKAGWTSNENYSKTPQDMLYARAAGRACDRTGAHILLGIPTTEDVPDTIEVTAAVGARVTAAEILGTASKPRLATTEADWDVRRPVGPDEPEPKPAPADEVPAPAPPDEPEPDRMTLAQQRKLFPLLKSRGYDDKDAALAFCAITIEREITSRNELTAAEAGLLIARLEAKPPVQNGETS